MMGSCYLDTRHQILFSVGAQLSDRQLRPREDHRLGEVLQHKRQGRGGEGHGVCAVEDDETVVFVIVVGDDLHDLLPQLR